MEKTRQYWILTVCAGLLAGIMNSLILLYLLLMISFSTKSVSFWMIVVIALCLPQCMRFMERWVGSVKTVQWIMVMVNALILIIYVFAVSSSGSRGGLYATVLISSVTEIAGLALMNAVSFIRKKQK